MLKINIFIVILAVACFHNFRIIANFQAEMKNMNPIRHSLEESAALHMKIGRLNLDDIDNKTLLNAVAEGEYDCLIARSNLNQPDLMLRMSQLNMPYAISGTIRRYKVDYTRFTKCKPYERNDWESELYDGSQNELLRELVYDVFAAEPLMYYNLPYYNKLVNNSDELECLYLYLKSFNCKNAIKPLKKLFFFKDKTGYFGLTAMTIFDEPKYSDSVLTGIRPIYRGKGIYKDLIRFIQNHHYQTGLDYCVCGARMQNMAAQKAFAKEDLYFTGNVLNLHIFPFLGNLSAINPDVFEAAISNNAEIWKLLPKLANQIANRTKLEGIECNPLKANRLIRFNESFRGDLKIVINYPIHTNEMTMAVAKFYNPSGELSAALQFEI